MLNKQGLTMNKAQEQAIVNSYITSEKIDSYITKSMGLENTLKNVVIRQLLKIKKIKDKKSIKESVEVILQNTKEKELRSRTKLRKLIQRNYETQAANDFEEEAKDKDALFKRVEINMDRLLKILTGHSQAVDSLERKLEEISAKRIDTKALKEKEARAAQEAEAALLMGSPRDDEEDMIKTQDLFLGLPMPEDDLLTN
jgi:hypothetical protein